MLGLLLAALLAMLSARGDNDWFRSSQLLSQAYSSKGGPVLRNYTVQDRVRYQLWDYKWHPDPDSADHPYPDQHHRPEGLRLPGRRARGGKSRARRAAGPKDTLTGHY